MRVSERRVPGVDGTVHVTPRTSQYCCLHSSRLHTMCPSEVLVLFSCERRSHASTSSPHPRSPITDQRLSTPHIQTTDMRDHTVTVSLRRVRGARDGYPIHSQIPYT